MKKLLFVLALVIILSLAACVSSDEPSTPADGSSNAPIAQEPADEPTDEPVPDDTGIDPGMFKVGTDLDAGEYVIVGTGYFELTSDSTGDFESILANDNYSNRTIITVNDGEYFKFDSGKMYPVEEAPAVDLSSGILQAGMYIVGKDLPAGEYKLIPDEDAFIGGYFELDKGSRHDLFDILSNDNFEAERYLTVADGQYLKLNSCTLTL